MSEEKIGVGSTVWVFDENRRVYEKDANGRAQGGPIWIKHWEPQVITGETRVSWLVGRWLKFPKNGAPGKVAFSWEEVKEREWVAVHRYGIERCVNSCRDPQALRQIAALVGYTEAPNAL